MKSKELHSLTPADLLEKRKEIKFELMKHNAQVASGTTPKSPGQIKQLKKTVARINTILMEKEKHKHE